MVFVAGLVFLGGISTFSWFKLDPISFRQLAVEPLRDGLFFYRALQPSSGRRLLRAEPAFRRRRIEIAAFKRRDLALVADLWEPDSGPGVHPALLILDLRGNPPPLGVVMSIGYASWFFAEIAVARHESGVKPTLWVGIVRFKRFLYIVLETFAQVAQKCHLGFGLLNYKGLGTAQEPRSRKIV